MHDRSPTIRSLAGLIGVVLCAAAAQPAHASPFATRVLAYDPAPGQNVGAAAFNNPLRALGPPVGGGLAAADNTKLVTLGGFGGSITLGFDAPILNLPPTATNPLGLDFIVFGNAFWVAGDPARRWAEAGVVEVSHDANANGLPDDAWFVIAGPALPSPAAAAATRQWDSDTASAEFPPANAAWIPPGRSGAWSTSGWLLPAAFAGPVVTDPGDGGVFGIRGLADISPTLLLGDTDGDDAIDAVGLNPAAFYTRPSDPRSAAPSPGSGGGDAIDLGWAVTAAGAPAALAAIDFVRISTGVDAVHPLFGERSTEVGAVARVIPPLLADIVAIGGFPPGDGELTVDDYTSFINAFAADEPLADIVSIGGFPPPDGELTVDDYTSFVNAFAEGG